MLTALLCALAAAPPAPAAPISPEPVAEGVFLFRGATGNAGLVVGPDAALLIDVPPTRPEAAALAAAVPGGLPVRWVLRTVRRGRPSEGERLFQSRGAVLAATPEGAAAAGPRVSVPGRLALHLGGERLVELRAWPGPVAGGAIAVVPDAAVVFGGEALWIRELPALGAQDPTPWGVSLSPLLSEFPSATYLPARGPAGRALDVRFLRDYLAGLRSGVARARAQGVGGPALAEALRERQRGRYGTWVGFEERAAANVSRMEGILAREEASRSATPRPTSTPGSSRQSSSKNTSSTPSVRPPGTTDSRTRAGSLGSWVTTD